MHDVELHKSWKRGAAIARQDMADSGVEGVVVVKVVESSEEIRLKLLKLMTTLTQVVVERGNTNLIHPYFHDTMLFIQAHLRDPYPEVKLEACRCLTALARSPALNQGMIYYALATARAALPVLRHRHAKVRAAAVRLVAAAVSVPYKAKCRGAGTDAIVDLIGYTAEDTIPVAAFYGNHTSVNYLAELCIDPVASVRLETARMLAEFIVALPDRYDHRTRIVPFLLNAVNDREEAIYECAMKALSVAGAEYESENQEDVIERRQYGVDGDRRALHLELPPPFKERPRLGERLYVRGCTRRFLKPLLNELTDWKGKTKLSSARLLRTVIVYTEEALTQDLNVLVPELCHAFKSLQSPDDDEVFQVLCQCCELLGRFIAPDSYVPFLLPRLKGELAVLPGGTDGGGRALVLLLTKLFMRGSSPKELVKHAEELAAALTDEVVLTSGIPELKSRALDACDSLVKALANSGSSLEAHYLSSGRLAHKARLMESLTLGLLVWRQDNSLKSSANTTLARLACVEARDEGDAKQRVKRFSELAVAMESLSKEQVEELKEVERWLVAWLTGKYCAQLSSTVCANYPLDTMWESSDVTHIVVAQLMELVCDVSALVVLLEMLEGMFEGGSEDIAELTEECSEFNKEWAKMLSNMCAKLQQCKDDPEGRLQNAVLCLCKRLCLTKRDVMSEQGGGDMWCMDAVASLLSLCDDKAWKQMRRQEAVRCASILTACLKPSVHVQARVKACVSIGHLLAMGTKGNGRLKAYKDTQGGQVKRDWLDVACIACNPLLGMLGDHLEQVRVEAARALQELLFYVSPVGTFKVNAGQEEKDSVDEGWARVNLSDISEEIGYTAAVDFISYNDFVQAIAPLMVSEMEVDWSVEEDSDASLDSLDALLRQAAIISPKLFLQALSEYSPLTGRLGELDAHAELLFNLERAKAGNAMCESGVSDLELD